MAKLPGALDLGALPGADPTRPVATYDVSPLVRGAAAVTEGAKALGAGVAKLGEGVGEYELSKDRWDYSKAHADFLSKSIEIENGVKHDTNYGPDENGKTLPQRFDETIGKQRDASAALIASGPMRERFMTDTAPLIARGSEIAKNRARGLENSADIAYVQQQGDNLTNKAIATSDAETRRQLIDSHNQLVDGLVAKGAVTPVQAVEMKRSWAHQYATADLLHRADTDPEGVINELRAAPGSSEDLTSRILRVEGSGKNAKSSATGTGQFIDATWLDVLKRNRPELAEGRSDQELLALRADKKLGREMTDTYRQENSTYLTKQGVEATPGAQYLAHFLGPGGAAAVLKADPNQPVADVLAKAVGPKQAQAMIDANPTILNGQLAGSVKRWADDKMGGQVPGGGSIYDILRPDVRETLLARAQGSLHKRNADDLTSFKTRLDDTTAEAFQTGTVAKPLTQTDFVAALGADVGLRKYKDYQAQMKFGRDLQSVASLDPDEQARLLESYQPKPGEEGYAAAAKRHDQLGQAIQRIVTERDKDPAAFAIGRLPVVQDAYSAFSKAMSDATVPLGTKQAAARELATKMDMEQARIGVPPELRRLVPKDYVDQFNKMISRPQSAGGTLNVAVAIEREAQLWGDRWPDVYREISKEARPVVRVIGAGVKPAAAQILADTAKMPLAEILKDQDAEKSATVKKDVLEAFKPLAASMTANEGGLRAFNDFRSQGEKLSAYYVMHGMASSDAAAKAFDDLVGFKYDFSGRSYRVPKDVPFAPALIASGVAQAKDTLGELGIAPARDTIGGLSPEYLKGATARAYARDGVWVTAPDESGLALIYKDQAVRKTDGKPLILSWAQLGQLGRARDGDTVRKNLEAFPTP